MLASHLQDSGLQCESLWHSEDDVGKFHTNMTIVTGICTKILTQTTVGQTGYNISQHYRPCHEQHLL